METLMNFPINENELVIWCPVWGDHHIDLVENFALRSLMWPDNLPACGYAKLQVVVAGVNSEWPKTNAAVSRALAGQDVSIISHCTDRPRDPLYSLRETMAYAWGRKLRVFICMPDIIHGNGSLSNMRNYARGKAKTIAAAHARVVESTFFSKYPDWTNWRSNRDLTRAAFSSGAFAWANSIHDNASLVGGVSWTQINSTTRLLVHHLPAPWLCFFTDGDCWWWDTRKTMGDFDHVWPGFIAQENRFRVIGSSDVAFAIELESQARFDELKPIPNTANIESYNHQRPNNEMCNGFLIAIHE
jgi:hypothetical protein